MLEMMLKSLLRIKKSSSGLSFGNSWSGRYILKRSKHYQKWFISRSNSI